jgi:hypothetical protein
MQNVPMKRFYWSDCRKVWCSGLVFFLMPCVNFVYYWTHVIGAGIAQWYSPGLWAGGSGDSNTAGAGNFCLHHVSRPALGPTQPDIQWVPGTLSLGVKRPEREADHFHLVLGSNNEWNYTSTPLLYLRGLVLSQKHRDNLNLTFELPWWYSVVSSYNNRILQLQFLKVPELFFH